MPSEVLTSIKVNGRVLSREDRTEFSVRGVRGRFAFDHARSRDGEILWVTAYGGSPSPMGIRSWRSFELSAIRTVHTKRKLR